MTDQKSKNTMGSASNHETTVSRRTAVKLAGVAGLGSLLSGRSAAGGEEHGNGFDPIEATISEIYAAIVQGDQTARSVTEHYLDRIEAYDDVLNTLITLNTDALARANELDETLAESGPVGPLHGVPMILKDNYDTSDMPTSAGSRILEDSVPPEDGFVVQQLREAGAIVLGKGNMDEWAHGGAPGGGYSSLGGQTLNPYDTDRGPAGSSGGPAAAAAANLAVFGMGTDTGGSIRGPVAANGLVGIKPTRGLASRNGIVPFALSLDVPGPMTRSVADAAIVLGVMAGVDPDDPETYKGIDQTHDDYTTFLGENGLAGARVGLMRDFFGGNPEVDNAIEAAATDMQRAGATVVDPVELPSEAIESVADIYYPIAETELKHYLGEYFDSLGEDAPVESLADVIEISSDPDFPINDTVLGRLEDAQTRGSLTDDHYRRTLESGQAMLQRVVDSVMEEHDLDALVSPTSGCPPEPIEEDPNFVCGDMPFRTAIANITGYPEVSVPAGFTNEGLPVSVSFFGQPFSEPRLLQLAYGYETQTGHRAPPEEFGPL